MRRGSTVLRIYNALGVGHFSAYPLGAFFLYKKILDHLKFDEEFFEECSLGFLLFYYIITLGALFYNQV